jgi:integrase
MGRKREHGVDLPEHVHIVVAKGKKYYFYQAHRGTSRQGPRIALPREPDELYAKARALAGTVPGYTGTVAAMIDAYMANEEFTGTSLSESTKRLYTRYLKDLKLALGKHKPDDIRPSHVIRLRDEFAHMPATANLMVSTLSTVYKWGRKRDYALNNPCTELGKLKIGEHKPWPQEIIDLVLTNARWEVRRFVLLTLATGQREGDVCRMSLHDIVDGEIRVIQEKTDKDLWIPLDQSLKSMVDECRKAGTIYLIPRGNGEPFTANQFRAMWGRELKKAMFKPIRELGLVPHGLCKNAHSVLFESGASTKEVQAVTGRSAAMAEYYGKGTEQRKLARRAIQRKDAQVPDEVLQLAEKH